MVFKDVIVVRLNGVTISMQLPSWTRKSVCVRMSLCGKGAAYILPGGFICIDLGISGCQKCGLKILRFM